jgi:hypothetical protein
MKKEQFTEYAQLHRQGSDTLSNINCTGSLYYFQSIKDVDG